MYISSLEENLLNHLQSKVYQTVGLGIWYMNPGSSVLWETWVGVCDSDEKIWGTSREKFRGQFREKKGAKLL